MIFAALWLSTGVLAGLVLGTFLTLHESQRRRDLREERKELAAWQRLRELNP